jgi:hypothetical protein
MDKVIARRPYIFATAAQEDQKTPQTLNFPAECSDTFENNYQLHSDNPNLCTSFHTFSTTGQFLLIEGTNANVFKTNKRNLLFVNSATLHS